MLKKIYHKKNELFKVEFYEDKECTETFDFKDAKNLYIELKDGDITPLCSIKTFQAYIFIPYIPDFAQNDAIREYSLKITTLNDIASNLSKYIPEDNAVLFLSGEEVDKYKNVFFKCGSICTSFAKISISDQIKWLKDGGLFHNKLTIFLPHGTPSELQKANEVAKELKEKYGVKEVNLFVLHNFQRLRVLEGGVAYIKIDFTYTANGNIPTAIPVLYEFINKIITTNSTGILESQNTERLQVIDCKELFEEYLKDNN